MYMLLNCACYSASKIDARWSAVSTFASIWLVWAVSFFVDGYSSAPVLNANSSNALKVFGLFTFGSIFDRIPFSNFNSFVRHHKTHQFEDFIQKYHFQQFACKPLLIASASSSIRTCQTAIATSIPESEKKKKINTYRLDLVTKEVFPWGKRMLKEGECGNEASIYIYRLHANINEIYSVYSTPKANPKRMHHIESYINGKQNKFR